jgi:hypothetical protein
MEVYSFDMDFGSLLCMRSVGASDNESHWVFGRAVIAGNEEFVSTADFDTGFFCLRQLMDPYLSQAQIYLKLDSDSLTPSQYFAAPIPTKCYLLSSVHSLKESIPSPQKAFSIASCYLIQTQLLLIL